MTTRLEKIFAGVDTHADTHHAAVIDWAAAMFSDSSSPVNWVGKSPGGAIHVS